MVIRRNAAEFLAQLLRSMRLTLARDTRFSLLNGVHSLPGDADALSQCLLCHLRMLKTQAPDRVANVVLAHVTPRGDSKTDAIRNAATRKPRSPTECNGRTAMC